MADVEVVENLFEPLNEIAEVTSLPADDETLYEYLPQYDGYIASLKIPLTRKIL